MVQYSMKQSTYMDAAPLLSAEKDLNPHPAYVRRFHAMAKPTGSRCNIDCQYCFYLHKKDLLGQPQQSHMSDETLSLFIQNYIDSQDGDEIIFSWQGGEPTLMGLDFFKKVIQLQQRYCPLGVTIKNDLQTNGVLLNKEWAIFLKQHDFLVGLSIDGPQELHDMYRVTRSGKPTFVLVMAAARILKKYGVQFNALAVINRKNVLYPKEVYRFLTQELGATYIQFTPCVEGNNFTQTAPQFWNEQMIPIIGSELSKPGHPMSVVTSWSVDPDDWGRFLISVFDEWVNNDLGRVLVNLFETAVAQTMGLPAQICVMAEFCGKGIAVEHDGKVYSCDHYVYPEYELGNIHQSSLNNLVFSTRQETFGMAKRDSLPNYCKSCPHLNLCWGECPKNRLIRTPDGELGLNYLCSGLSQFFEHAKPILNGIAAILERKE
ncbi:anaerobic sulfatase maturase [Shewanella woodyi]|uniref:Radical SAM domain protein n=1 Tax=Shewanella woodyi (strain ATCC 51908 / MS32) TaxID=392500 RepID=B1KPE6_SHEWM|nr:anaerobic sulfatase maturase [Shewanella woodyi]ACA84716.1 Radical SAM domain protein [Shewanella woodyi ATCC 51908]